MQDVIQVPRMPTAVRDLKQQNTKAVSKVNVGRVATSVVSDGNFCQISADNGEFFSQIAKKISCNFIFLHFYNI